MDVIYMKDVNRSYMILSEEEEQEMDYQIPMLEKNEILGLLPFHIKQVDRQLQYCYEISGRESIKKWLEENKLNEMQVKILIDSLSKTINELDSYLLSDQCLLLTEEYIYIDMEDWSVYFCYYPPNHKSKEEGIRFLLQLILKKIDHNDRDAVFFAYRLFQESLNDNISLKKLQIIMERKESDDWNPYKKKEDIENKTEIEEENLGDDFEYEDEDEILEENVSPPIKQDESESKIKKNAHISLNLWNSKQKTQSDTLRWNLPEQLGVNSKKEPVKKVKAPEIASKIEDSNISSKDKENVISEKIWMAVPFLTLIGVIIIFSGKLIPIQKIWAKYPWVCMGVLLFALGSNFIIVKRWYFDEE